MADCQTGDTVCNMAEATFPETARMRLLPPACAAIAAASILSFVPDRPAVAADVTCPFEISVQQTLAEPVEGWATYVDPWPTELVNLSVFDGPPEELAELIFDDEIEDADTWSVFWLLQAENPRGYWIRCRYANTLVNIEQQLPAGVTRCEIVFEKMMSYADGRPVVRSMRCG